MALQLIGSSPQAFTYFGAHQHTYFEIILNLEGDGIITIGTQDFPFHAGSVHVIPPNTPHTKYANNCFRDIYLLTDKLFFTPITGSKHQPIILEDDNGKPFEQLMKMMLDRYLRKNKNDPVLQTMHELLMKIIEEAYVSDHQDPVISSVIQTLTASFNDPELSVSEVLSCMGYNKDHLRRKFVAAIGVTPNEYLTAIRINHAKKLLQEQRRIGMSIAEVGALCGYCDTCYFSRIFKQKTGYSPTEYLKKNGSDQNSS